MNNMLSVTMDELLMRKRIEELEAELQGRDEAKELLLDRIEVLEAALRSVVAEGRYQSIPHPENKELVEIARAALDKDAGK